MRIRLLGTAAGGGVPQWNCNCPVCREARSGSNRVWPRTQSCVAVSGQADQWFLLNASPDLRWQIEGFPPLHPPPVNGRGSPIAGVLLTNADLDHTLGLFSLREGQHLRVHATAAVRKSLTEGLSLAPALEAFCGVEWILPSTELTPLLGRENLDSGLVYQAIPLKGRPPRFASWPAGGGDVTAYHLVDRQTKGRLVFAPETAGLDQDLQAIASGCDVLLIDGSFWSEDEMKTRGFSKASASEFGHWPISGTNGSLQRMKQIRAKRTIYTHINNTNPVLFEDSPERREVLQAGCEIAFDGMELSI